MEFVSPSICPCVCPTEIINNFWMGKWIWTKFSGLAWLASSNFWVSSPPAQSPPGRSWPAPSPFPWSGPAPWLLVLLGHVIPFWKAVDEPNNRGRADFWFWAWGPISGLWGGTSRGWTFLRIWQFFIKQTPLNLNFKRCIFFAFWFKIIFVG